MSNDSFQFKEFFYGGSAALINVTITYPVSKLMFRQMLHGIKIRNAGYQLKNEGFFYLYRGILPCLIQKPISVSLMFGIYEEIRRPLSQMGVNPYMCKVYGSIGSGLIETSLLMPFERIQTIMADSKYHEQYTNTANALKNLRQFGKKEYYRGYTAVLFRTTVATTTFFTLRDEIRSMCPKKEKNRPVFGMFVDFLCGASVGIIVSTFVYPVNVIKVAMQSNIGGEFENPWLVLKDTYKKRGNKIWNLYHGAGTNCLRAMLSWGIVNVAYEFMKTVI